MDMKIHNSERLQRLKGRKNRCLCKYCGGKLTLKKILVNEFEDARVELYCNHCDRIEFGVEPEIYYSAKYFVEELNFNCFPNLDDNHVTRQMSIAKVNEIMSWENKTLGILDDNGFKIPVQRDSNIVGECLVLDDTTIDQLDKKTVLEAQEVESYE